MVFTSINFAYFFAYNKADRLKSKDYKGVTTKDIVYKKHKDYELILTVDFAETEKPAPFVVYIHGGGWARGNNGCG